jgi:hypothetical protein
LNGIAFWCGESRAPTAGNASARRGSWFEPERCASPDLVEADVGIFDGDKNETRHPIDSLDEIYLHATAMWDAVRIHQFQGERSLLSPLAERRLSGDCTFEERLRGLLPEVSDHTCLRRKGRRSMSQGGERLYSRAEQTQF